MYYININIKSNFFYYINSLLARENYIKNINILVKVTQ